MSIFSRLFHLRPRYEVSGYRTIYKALVSRLERQGVTVGGTAKYPRVEVHSIREQERLDKEGEPFEVYPNIRISGARGNMANQERLLADAPAHRGPVSGVDQICFSRQCIVNPAAKEYNLLMAP